MSQVRHKWALAAAILLLDSIFVTDGAAGQTFTNLHVLNCRLQGEVREHRTGCLKNSGLDSQLLGESRSLYVYLPPGYDSRRAYPLVLWLHGGFGDEHAFLGGALLPELDEKISQGCLPPMIVACPDGTCSGRNSICSPHSLYVNGCCGRFEDHIVYEVIPFLESCYQICGDRRHRALLGISAGGLGAMTIALKHRARFGAVATLAGALNLRYDNCHHDYFRDFDPAEYRWKTEYDSREVVGKYIAGLVRFRAGRFASPVFGDDECVIQRVAQVNPADVLCRCGVQPGELQMFIAYGQRDNLNMDAQAESFIWLARGRGLPVDVYCDPVGRHDKHFFHPAQSAAWEWLGHRFRVPCGNIETDCTLELPVDPGFVPPSVEPTTSSMETPGP